MTDILQCLAARTPEHPAIAELREYTRRGFGFVAKTDCRTWVLTDEEMRAINIGVRVLDASHRDLIALVQEAAGEIERLRGLMNVVRMKAEWRFQGSDFVAEGDSAYARVSDTAIAATAYLREILAIANKALNPQEAS